MRQGRPSISVRAFHLVDGQVDWIVGNLVAALDRLSLMENTLLLFTGEQPLPD